MTVYERTPGGCLQIQWWVGGERHRESLRTVAGHPVTDRELAMEIAEAMSKAQERKANAATAAQLLGLPEPRTLRELLAQLHRDKAGTWSEPHKRDQDRYRAFWLKALGPDQVLTDITEGLVERMVRRASEARDKPWSPRTVQAYLRYLKDAMTYAADKLKWVPQEAKLTGLSMPKLRKRRGKPYTLKECQLLLPELEKRDLRAALVAWLGYAGGRRLNASRQLRVEAYREEDGFGVVHAPEDTDKVKAEGTVVLPPRARDVVRQLLDTPAVKATGLLCPSGSLQSAKKRGRGPATRDELYGVLRQAEKAVEVEHRKGRFYHGFKRRFATDAEDRRTASLQSGTTEQTLADWYEHDESLEGRKRVAMEAEKRLQEDGTGTRSGTSAPKKKAGNAT